MSGTMEDYGDAKRLAEEIAADNGRIAFVIGHHAGGGRWLYDARLEGEAVNEALVNGWARLETVAPPADAQPKVVVRGWPAQVRLAERKVCESEARAGDVAMRYLESGFLTRMYPASAAEGDPRHIAEAFSFDGRPG